MWRTVQPRGRRAGVCNERGVGGVEETGIDVTERTMLEVYNEPSRRELRLQLPSRLDVDPCFACERM